MSGAALILDDPCALSEPETPPRKRGRPVGWRMPTFATLRDLTIEDFSFLRGIASGMEPKAAFLQFYANRHFDAEGNPIIPHGLTINAHERELLDRLQAAGRASSDPLIHAAALTLQTPTPQTHSEAVAARTHLEFNDWVESQPEDMFSEAELAERYREYLQDLGLDPDALADASAVLDRSAVISGKIRALGLLQTQLARLPSRDSPTTIWLAPSLHKALLRHGVRTMGDLVDHISSTGRHWHRTVDKLGPGRAARVEAWLDSHRETLGPVRRVGLHWTGAPALSTVLRPLEIAPDLVELEYRPGAQVATPKAGQLQRSFGIVPLELLLVPRELDGHNGLFRTSSPNHLGAKNDYEALLLWLGTFLSAGKRRTFLAYRHEMERFYLWCLLEARVPLSGVSLGHAQAYQAFLRAIPARYINPVDRVPREHPDWRPWRGQLSVSSQNYAITVVSSFYAALHANAYVTGNPFTSIRPAAGGKTRALDTTRSLSDHDLQVVREALANLSGLRSADPYHAALARRTRLILHLALTTGMRLEEMATATLATLRPAVLDGQVSDEDWLIDVRGKGSRERSVPITASVLAMIREHHSDWERLMPEAAARLASFRAAPPLIAALQAPVPPAKLRPPTMPLLPALEVQGDQRQIRDDTPLANDNAALGRAALYRTLKTFFRATARPHLRRAKAMVARLGKRPAGDVEQVCEIDETGTLEHWQRELARWERFESFSTHWLRHTFAHAMLRANRSDEGLKLTQQLLGHASISTTSGYLTQDETAKVLAARKVSPLN